VRYTFGVEPLQQYLLALPGGRLQALGVAWDDRSATVGGQRWFHLHPDETVDHNDVLHWTRDSQNWNYMCADCHSTAVNKRYDADSRTYQTSFAEDTVGCEACHGPGSQHAAGTNIVALENQATQLNTCAPCHSRRSQLAEGFDPERSYFDHYLPSLLDEGLYHADGQILDEVYVYGSFLQSKMHDRGVTCSDCHDAHSAKLRVAGNALCTQCHNEAGRPDFRSLQRADYDSDAHHFHTQDDEGSRCVACHMPAVTYMGVDERRDHSFRIPRPDLTLALGVPNACEACHGDQPPEWARDVLEARFGTEQTSHFGSVFAAARALEPAAELELAAIGEDPVQPAIVRATAMSLMVAYQRGATALALEKGLRDPNPLVRIGALRGAARWEPQQRWSKCKHLLDDEHLVVRTQAARVLGDALNALPDGERARLAASLVAYLEVLALNADRAEAQAAMASVHLQMGDPVQAERSFELALELNPQWVPALVNLADLYRATGRDAEGGRFLSQAVDLVPDAPDVLLANALWLVRQDRSDEALPLLERASAIAPENPRYTYVYAVALHSSGQSELALEVLDAALDRRPNDQQLLGTAFGIARDTGLSEKVGAYRKQLEAR
jgi:predicted CXXCH cytochrome family protein